MKTELMKASPEAFERAGALIRRGEVVGFPTETVYGLGADAGNSAAVDKIFAAKGRPGDNPLIVHISELNQLRGIIRGEMPDAALRLAQAYWPGPLTMIFPRGERVSTRVTAGLDSVAVRFPSHPAARALISAAGCPIAAPSANLSGKPSPTAAAHVLNDLNGRIPLIIDGGACEVGLESTVLDLTDTPARLLRPGGITPGMIADVLGEVEVDGSALRPMSEGEVARSPGMKYKHYAPEGALVVVKGERAAVARRICEMYDAAQGEKRILCLEENIPLYGRRRALSLGSDTRGFAHSIFALLREMDAEHVNAIFCESVEAEGIGLAVMNRLGRAAAFHIIQA